MADPKPTLRRPEQGEKTEEVLPELVSNQGVLYLRRKEGGAAYEVASGVYMGSMRDVAPRGGERRAVIAQQQNIHPAEVAQQYEEKHHAQAGGTIVHRFDGRQSAVVDPRVLESATDVPLRDTQRLNQPRSAIVEYVNSRAARFVPEGHVVVGPVGPRDFQTVAPDLQSGRMSAEAYRVVEAAFTMHLVYILRDLEMPIPKTEKSGWEHALHCLEMVERETQVVEREFRAFLAAQEERIAEMRRIARPTTQQKLEMFSLIGGVDKVREMNDSTFVGKYAKARKEIVKEVGLLLTAANWYHESNPSKP
jgi:hypothetical protein